MIDEGDRLPTTYHHPVSAMNRTFQSGGDRLKEDFHFYVWGEYENKLFLSINPKLNKNELNLFTRNR